MENEVSMTVGFFEERDFDLNKYDIHEKFNIYGEKQLIHLATIDGNINNLKKIIDRGGDIESKDIKGHTPIYYAVRENHTEISRFLLYKMNKKKKIIDIVFNINNLIKYNNQILLDLILRQYGVKFEGIPEFKMIDNDNVKMLKKIIQFYNDREINIYIKKVCLMYSITNNAHKCIQFLIKSIGHIKSIEKFNNTTFLIQAVKKNNIKLVEYLLEQGCNPNVLINNGESPIAFAVLNKNKKIIDLLLKHNTRVNILIPIFEETIKTKHKQLINLVIKCMEMEELYKYQNKYNTELFQGLLHESWKPITFYFHKKNIITQDIGQIIKSFIC